MATGSSSSNPRCPCNTYPSQVCGPSIVTMKLSGRETYQVWKTQMMCLLESHDMLGFITQAENRVLGKEKIGDQMLWRRSDALVKAWILASLSEETLKYVVNSMPNKDFTAKDVWDKLNTIYGPLLLHQHEAETDYEHETQVSIRREESVERVDEERDKTRKKEVKRRRKEDEDLKGKLYEATLDQVFGIVERTISKKVVTLGDKITINGNTALHVAVGTSKNNMEFLKNMLNLATQDNQPLDVRNSEGSTLLHVAAIVGNTAAAKLLVEKDPNLLYATDNEGQTPLTRALSNMHTDTYLYLRDRYFHHQDMEKGDLFDGTAGCELLVNMISSKDYIAAWDLLDSNKKLPSDTDSVLMAIAQNFPPKLTFWESIISAGDMILRVLVPLRFKFVEATQRKANACDYAERLLDDICVLIKSEAESRLHHDYYSNAILEATRQNADMVIKIIVFHFPNAIWSTNEYGHNIIQYAVINRSEKIYNLLYQMSEHKNMYRTIKDSFGNNLLHLTARLAPTNKLNSISGAALQLQFELQWFKEVEAFVCPLNIIQKNSFGETPEMVFTKEHKELVIEGEKWMKETAQSYTITATLITTIVFAAAITVPGGNKQDNGIPMFTNKTAFTIFAVSDAISLFTSVTSLLMFLSILTARFSEQDFLYKLPTKLIIGLATLFISTTAMLVAFGATLLLMFGQNNLLILVPIASLTCLPIASFMTLQFPLIYDLISAMCGRSIFGKKDDSRPFY